MLGAFNRFYLSAVALPALVVAMAMPVSAEPVARNGAAAGAVIARKVGEEVRFIDVSDWRTVDLKQDLLSGDILRTNETGQLAILFSDRTQVRLGRNSSLVVKQVTSSTNADTVLQLQSGTIWARAERGGPGVKVETPAAAAAIRGTDWTMTVNGANTSLNVLEGVVQLSNPQGSVEVRQGEGAAATIGQIPRKIAIVNSDDREQMLYYLAPRNAFAFMPASPLPVAEMRRQIDRISATTPTSRTSEDLLVLAETQLSLESRDKTNTTLKMLEERKLSAAQQARLDLIKAVLAASEKRYDDATKLFAKASPKLDARRKNIAVYGSYYSRSLGNPKRVESPPTAIESSYSALLRAYTAGFLKDIPSAIEVIREAEKRYPNDATLPAYRAQFAILINDRKQVEDAIAKSLALDPAEPTALEARANYRSDFKGDVTGAMEDLRAALKVAPGSTTIWNALGNTYMERDDNKRAEQAFKTSIALDPQDPVAYSNLTSLYLSQDRMAEAKELIDKALQVDPGFDLALIDRGAYNLRNGKLDEAIGDILAGTVANPAYSAGQTFLAIAHYQKGDRVAGAQALDNADRLDNNDPVISSIRTTVAIDEYDSESAIRNAQEYVRRARARGGDYSSLGANQQAGSTLNDAFRLQGMNSWAEYYSDISFDPFIGMSYVDQSIRGSVNPFANSFEYGQDIVNNTSNSHGFSSILQGLMLDPQLIAGKTIGISFYPQPFIEGSIGAGFSSSNGGSGYIGEGEIQAYSNELFPISFNANIQWDRTPEDRDFGLLTIDTNNKPVSGTVYFTANPTPDDRVVLYYSHTDADFRRYLREDDGLGSSATSNLDSSSTIANGGIGWSHTIEYKNVVNTAFLFSKNSNKSREYRDFFAIGIPIFALVEDKKTTQDTYIAAVNHAIEIDDFSLRYGIEGGWIEAGNFSGITPSPTPPVSLNETTSVGRAYIDLLHEVTPNLKAEYALFGSYLDSDGLDVRRLDPRVGIAWSPVEGHWLRAGFIRDSFDVSTPTLSPIGVVGLQPNQISIDPSGSVDTIALRWDAEWTSSVFTALEFQHQDIRDASIPLPLVADTFDTDRGTIDRLSLTGNFVLGGGFGLSSTIAYSDTDDKSSSPAAGGQLPFVPEWAGQVALTWVSPMNVKTTLAANYVGDRVDAVGFHLDDYWTLDAAVSWEPFDNRLQVELSAYNLLDDDIQISGNLPGWGRSFKGTLKVRF